MFPKVSIIGGAGNVGATTCMRIINSGLADCVLIDIDTKLAMAKKMDLEDSNSILKSDVKVTSTQDFSQVKNSGVIIITAGLARKPNMSREDLIKNNAGIIKEVAGNIKKYITDSTIVIIVTNPLDIMTYLSLKILDMPRERLFGMGAGLDNGRFANLIADELNCPNSDIEAVVIGAHGKEMIPLPRFSFVKGKTLIELLPEDKIKELIVKTINRGTEIVSLFGGSGSAYFGPSAAIFQITKSILKDITLRTCASVYLKGEYGLSDVCIGIPVQINSSGISNITELGLNDNEKKSLHAAAENLKNSIKQIEI